VKPVSTSLVYKPKQLMTETQISLSCEVEGSVPDTDIKWTQNNRLFERGSVSNLQFILIMKNKHFMNYVFSQLKNQLK
jgi:hypothetical protein